MALCQPCIQFCFISHFKRRPATASLLLEIRQEELVSYIYALREPLHSNHFFIIFNLPLSFFIFYFPPLHNFLIFPPQFLIPSCTILLFSLLLINFFYSLLHNFIILFPSSFLNSLLLYNSKFFPPPLLLEFLPPQFLLFSLFNLDFPPPPPPPHLFYIFSIHK